MKITEGLRESFDVIRGNKVRSFLTILGINFGVGCLIAISVVGLGFRFSIESELGRYGSTLLWVQVSWRAYAGNEPRIQMDDRDIEYFKTALPGVESGESIFDISYPVSYKGRSHETVLYGVEPAHFAMFDVGMQSGRQILQKDMEDRSRVCVLRPDIAAKLFQDEDPIGKTIRIDERNFTVIGLTERLEGGFLSDGSDNNTIFVPAPFIASRIWGGNEIKYWVYLLRFESPDNLDIAEERISAYLEKRYGKLRGESRFIVSRLDSFTAMTERILDIVNTLVVVIASISLVVGGLGIMNIMLVAVTERTREIGVRMAVGATRTDILVQFIIEAVVLCLVGGGTGVLFGVLLAVGACTVLGWPFTLPVLMVLGALAVSTVIGMAFGIYPAYKASGLQPVDALRTEA
jgi:putative ABC transport system permease protein